MTGFLLSLMATLVLGLGSRDQVLMAGFSARMGQRPSLLIVGIISAVAAAAGAVWLAGSFAPLLEPAARKMLAVLALGLAALEMIVIRPKPLPGEPTQSLGAFSLVLLSLQLTDAARFVLFAIVVASLLPAASGLGGAIGGAAIIAAGWAAGNALLALPLTRIRRWLGAALLLIAAVLFFAVRQGIGA